MIELKRVIAPADGTPFDDICSFETENYIGIYINHSSNLYKSGFVIMPKNDIEFTIDFIEAPNSLDELDNAVYDKTDERIVSVSTSRSLEIKIDEGE